MVDLIMVFRDTEKTYHKNPVLKNSIEKTVKKQYTLSASQQIKSSGNKYEKPVEITVSGKRSFEAAKAYKDKKICVLNFASATHVGGGVVNGASAQEECLCRCSTLYPALLEEEAYFHAKHRQLLREGKMNSTYNDDCVYSPGVTVFKSDTKHPQLLPENEWYDVDVITCAAPNLNRFYGSADISDEEITRLHHSRARRILELAKSEGEEVLILGAFGCGAFRNPPLIVAKAWADVIEDFKFDFETVEFAVMSDRNKPTENYLTFKKVFC